MTGNGRHLVVRRRPLHKICVGGFIQLVVDSHPLNLLPGSPECLNASVFAVDEDRIHASICFKG